MGYDDRSLTASTDTPIVCSSQLAQQVGAHPDYHIYEDQHGSETIINNTRYHYKKQNFTKTVIILTTNGVSLPGRRQIR